MTPYSKWSPTGFDRKGLNLPDRQDWLVACIMQTRDSEPLHKARFGLTVAELGGESETVEVHSFSHWGPGWIEIILVKPTRKAKLVKIEEALEIQE